MTDARIEVWLDADARWRWRYRDAEGVDLLSNEGHLDRDAAVHAASVAYPGVPVEVLGRAETPGRSRRGVAGSAAFLLMNVVLAIPIAVARLARGLARLLRR